MSRGIGRMQRAIIAAGGATATLFDCVKTVNVVVESSEQHPGFEDAGYSFYWYRRVFSDQSVLDMQALRDEYPDASVELHQDWLKDHWHDVLPSLISYGHCHVALFPELFSGDLREWGNAFDPRGCDRMMLLCPPDVKRKRSSARTGISRAFRQMVKRGLMLKGWRYPWYEREIPSRPDMKQRVTGHDDGESTFYAVITTEGLAASVSPKA